MPLFPTARPRRVRSHPGLRELVREQTLRTDGLIYPLFVRESDQLAAEVPQLPGIERFTLDRLVQEARACSELGVKAVLLFGLPTDKDELATAAYADDGIVQRAVAEIKREVPKLVVITDVCLCQYSNHGHCGVLTANGEVDNDASLELLAQVAVSHARAGADMVAPSDMMDGRVAVIRQALDQAGFTQLPIMSYATKFSSAFYGPFRAVAESAPQRGDRLGYQLDPANAREAVREALLDVEEGADILMVKPALAYLDVIAAVKQATDLPLAAFSVSGEYAMLKAAAATGALDEQAAVLEALFSIQRAGADMLITYHAKDVARWLQ